jgi:hypothetical protein
MGDSMVRLTEKEWKELKDKAGLNDPEGEDLEMKKLLKEMERIQYFCSDLSYALDIGQIADMHVDTENGVQILRMTVIPKEKDTFKTIRTVPKKQAAQAAKRNQSASTSPRRAPPQAPVIDADSRVGIGATLMQMGKNYMSKKDKPPWMK